MTKNRYLDQKTTAYPQMGLDGWVTLLISTLVITLTCCLTLLWQLRVVWRYAKYSSTELPEGAELVLIPGMLLVHGQVNHDYLLRLQRGICLYMRHKPRVMLMGGFTGSNPISEARSGYDYLVSNGVSSEDLLLEERSRNTLENLKNSREQLRNANITYIALVSNRYHLARCLTLARGLGMNIKACAAEENSYFSLRMWPRLLLEAYYLHWYHTGKVWSRLTKNRHSLSRIS